jgi:hypothetical protein
MPGGKVPGPLDGAKAGPIDKGTLNRQPSQPPGPLVLRHRYHLPWELSSNRKLVEFNPDPGTLSGAERLRWKHMGGDQYSNVPTRSEYESWFEGFRLPKVSPILLLPNPDFQATPWENAFGLTFAQSHPNSNPILNASNEVIGHVAYFRNDQIFVPKMLGNLGLSDVVAAGMPAFVRKKNPNPRFWSDSSRPQVSYQLVVTAGGEVIAVLSARDREGDAYISTWSFILTVVTIVDGVFLVRGALSAAGRAALSRIDAQLAKRAMAAAERERLEAAGKLAAKGKDALARTQPVWPLAGKDASPFALAQPREAFADTAKAADAVPKPPGATGNTGDFAAAARESELEGRFGAMNQETFEEIEKARAARGSDPLAAYGDEWMDEVSDIITRVGQKHFPNGVPLD